MYYSCDQVQKDEMNILGIQEENVKIGRRSHRWEDNIRRILRTEEMKVWTGLMWSRIGKNNNFFEQDKIKFSFPLKSENFLTRYGSCCC
jgi:hypothetical protein